MSNQELREFKQALAEYSREHKTRPAILESLKRSGILTSKGKLAWPYRTVKRTKKTG